MSLKQLIAFLFFIPTMAISVPTLARTDDARFVLAGYGKVDYENNPDADTSNFAVDFVPIFLFSLNDKIHVEAETEIAIDENGGTEIELEYANFHYFLTDTTTVSAGKFLLPFGQFGPNLHPSWINRSPWTPGIYASHGASQAMTPLLPILSDVGVALQQTFVLSGQHKIFVDIYSTNGPSPEVEGHGDEPTEDAEEHEEETDDHATIPELAFEATSRDNNKNKAFGGRVAYAMLPGIEAGVSYYKASYDHDEALDFIAQGVDINYTGSHFFVRGEYIKTQTDGLEEGHEGETEIRTFDRNGWYVQGTFQAGKVWPAFKGTEFVLEYAETNQIAEAERWMLGVNYWLDARSVIKIAYDETSLQEEENDQRFAIQLSYGF